MPFTYYHFSLQNCFSCRYHIYACLRHRWALPPVSLEYKHTCFSRVTDIGSSGKEISIPAMLSLSGMEALSGVPLLEFSWRMEGHYLSTTTRHFPAQECLFWGCLEDLLCTGLSYIYDSAACTACVTVYRGVGSPTLIEPAPPPALLLGCASLDAHSFSPWEVGDSLPACSG